jgi:hypothetical protein
LGDDSFFTSRIVSTNKDKPCSING